MEKVIYFDCCRGISGDMVLGACVDLGVDVKVLKKELSKLHIDGFDIIAEKMVKNGFSGTDVNIVFREDGVSCGDRQYRTLKEIKEIVLNSDLEESVKETALNIFMVIAEAEAKVHGKSAEAITFHEVGALDSIMDICGAAVCLNLLGVENVYCSVVCEGTGFIMCRRGQLPVPVPAVVNMMPGSGIIVKQTDEIHTELITPTGFGILKGTKAVCGTMPEMIVEEIGIGFGKRDTGRLNGLRAVLGTMMEADDRNVVIEHFSTPEREEEDYVHSHSHTHSAEHKVKVRNRLAKAIGHLEKVKQMVENDSDCCEVLVQLAALKSALNNTGKYILKEHMYHCLIEAVEHKEFSEIDDLNKAIDYFIK